MGAIYSQDREDQFIAEWFSGKTTGKLLDIGAYDGVTGSNCLRLLEHGWSGLLVDAGPEVFEKLSANMRSRNLAGRTSLLHAAIVPDYYPRASAIDFYEAGRLDFFGFGLGSIISNEHEVYARNKNLFDLRVELRQVPCMRCSDLFADIGYDWDFISVDVEGINYELMLDIPWSQLHNLSLFCIEGDMTRPRIERAMAVNGLRCVEHIDCNFFFAPHHHRPS